MAGKSSNSDSKDVQTPWVSEFLEGIIEITRNKVLDCCDIINKVGVDEETKEEWKRIFTSNISDNYKEIIDKMTLQQSRLIDEIDNLLHKSKVLCKELSIELPKYGSQDLTFMEERSILKDRIKEYEKLLEARHLEIQKLNFKEEKLCKSLDKRPKGLSLSPLPSAEALEDFRDYLEALEFDKYERVAHFASLKPSIEEIMVELNYKPFLDFERMVVSIEESKFVVSDANMAKLNNFFDSLKQLADETREEISLLREELRQLWERLDEDPKYCDEFIQTCTGNSLSVLADLKAEIDRQKANIEGLVKASRKQLLELWSKCHLQDAEREFKYFHTDLYTEDLLTLHDIEIQEMERYYSEHKKIFALLEERKSLWEKMAILEQQAAQPDRYKNRGGQLLKEEKERNAISKRIPHIEEQLVQLAEAYHNSNGKPFLTWGETIFDIIQRDHARYEEENKLKLSVRKMKRDKTITPSKSITAYGSVQNVACFNPDVGTLKRKLATPLHSAKRTRPGTRENNAPHTAPPNITVNDKPVGSASYSIERAKRIAKCRMISRSAEKRALIEKNTPMSSAEYDEFEKDIKNKENCRRTILEDSNNENAPLAVALPITPQRPKTPRRAQSPPLKLLF